MSDNNANQIQPVFDGGGKYLEAQTGFVVGARGDALMRLDTDRHFITIGPTGAGKGTSVGIPNLLTHTGSVFSVEIGGATLKATYDYRRHVLNQNIFILDPLRTVTENSDCFNPLDILNPEEPGFTSGLTHFAETILQSSEGAKENSQPFFHNAPKELLKSLIIYVKTAPEIRDDQRNLPYISRLLHGLKSSNSLGGETAEERWSALMQRFESDTSPYSDQLASTAAMFINNPNDSPRDVISTLSGWLGFARDAEMAPLLERSTFDIKKLSKEKTSIYVVMRDAKDYNVYHTWLRLLVECAMDACPNLGDGGRSLQSSNDRTLFILDEFTQIGKLSAVKDGMVTARQKGITFWCMFQDFPRLKDVYGENIANSFIGNAGCIQAFETGDPVTAELLTKYMGRKLVYIPSVSWAFTDTQGNTISEGKTNGIAANTGWNESMAHGKNESWSRSVSNGSSFSTSYAMGNSYSTTWGNGSYSSTSGRSSGTTNTHGSSTTTTNTIGGGTSETYTKGVSGGDSINYSEQTGKQSSSSLGKTYTVSYAPQIIPKADAAEIMEAVNSQAAQLLIIRDKDGLRKILESRPYYYRIPELAARAEGLIPPQMPEVMLRVGVPKSFSLLPAPEIRVTIPPMLRPVSTEVSIGAFQTDMRNVRLDISRHELAVSVFKREKITLTEIAEITKTIEAQARAAGDFAVGGLRKQLHQIKEVETDLIMTLVDQAQRRIEAMKPVLQTLVESDERIARNLYEYVADSQKATANMAQFARVVSQRSEKVAEFQDYLNNRYLPALNQHVAELGTIKKNLGFLETGLVNYCDYRNNWPELKQPLPPRYLSSPELEAHAARNFHAGDLAVAALVPVVQVKKPPAPLNAVVRKPVSIFTAPNLKLYLEQTPVRYFNTANKQHPNVSASELTTQIRAIDQRLKDVLSQDQGWGSDIANYCQRYKNRRDLKRREYLVEHRHQLAESALQRVEGTLGDFMGKVTAYVQASRASRIEWNGIISRLNAHTGELKTTQKYLLATFQGLNLGIDKLEARRQRLNEIDLSVAGKKNAIMQQVSKWNIWSALRKQTEIQSDVAVTRPDRKQRLKQFKKFGNG